LYSSVLAFPGVLDLGKQLAKAGGTQHAGLQCTAVPGRGTLRLDGS